MGIIIDRIQFVEASSNAPTHSRHGHGRRPAAESPQNVATVFFHEEGSSDTHSVRMVEDRNAASTNLFSEGTTNLFRNIPTFRWSIDLNATDQSRQTTLLNAASFDPTAAAFQRQIYLTRSLTASGHMYEGTASLMNILSLGSVMPNPTPELDMRPHTALFESLAYYFVFNRPQSDTVSNTAVNGIFTSLANLNYERQARLFEGLNLTLSTDNRRYINDISTFSALQPPSIERVNRVYDALQLLKNIQEPLRNNPAFSAALQGRAHDIAASVARFLETGTPAFDSFKENLVALALEVYRLSPEENRVDLLQIISESTSRWNARAFFQAPYSENAARLNELRTFLNSSDLVTARRLALMNPSEALVASVVQRLHTENLFSNGSPHSANENVDFPQGFNREWLNSHLDEIVTAALGADAAHPERTAVQLLSNENGVVSVQVNVEKLINNFENLLEHRSGRIELYWSALLVISRHLFGNGQAREQLRGFYQGQVRDLPVVYTDRAILNRYYTHLISSLGVNRGETNTMRDVVVPLVGGVLALGGAAAFISSVIVAEQSGGRTGFVPGEVSAGAMAGGIPLGMGLGVFTCRLFSRPSRNPNWLRQDLLCAGIGGAVGSSAGWIPALLDPAPVPPMMTMPPVVVPPRPETPPATPSGPPLGP